MRFYRFFWIWIFFFCLRSHVLTDDWPTFRCDTRRSGVTSAAIDAANLTEAWIHRSVAPPRTAWAAPAKWDSYSHVRGLRAMRDYDQAFHVIVAGEMLYFGSSVDDSVYALEARSGKLRWMYTTDAPVRVAPSYADGRIYFGSDDGHAYCVNAETGELVWKYGPPTQEPLILNNGRLIPYWPCRSGVLVSGDTAYFACSLLPWRPSYLCAVNAKTGTPDGPGRFVRQLDSVTIEAALLETSTQLIAPQGRVPPTVLNRENGKPLGALEGGGGSRVTVAASGDIVHGPGNKTGWITVSDLATFEGKRTFQDCAAMVVDRSTAYLLSDTLLTAVELTSGRELWRANASFPHDIILAGGTLFVGGNDEVAAFRAADGKRVWSANVEGRAFGLAAAHGALFVSTDEGAIHCFRADVEPRVRPKATTIERSDAVDLAVTDATAPSPVTAPSRRDPSVVSAWLFHTGMGAQARRRGLPLPEKRVSDEAGGLHALIMGDVQLRQLGSLEALELDGLTNSITIARDASKSLLPEQKIPRQDISVEAWVRVDQPSQRGGILGAVEIEKNLERGWLLAYRESRFFFAVKGDEGDEKMTFLEAATEIEQGAWYHVVGTYDGSVQKIYVNGKLENTSQGQRGAIHYPDRAHYQIGNYRRRGLDARFSGWLHQVRVYERVLNDEDAKKRFDERREQFPQPIELALGPYAQFYFDGTALVQYHTATPSPTWLEYRVAGELRSYVDAELKTTHEATLDGLRRDLVVPYWIKTGIDGTRSTPIFELDTHFNHNVRDVGPGLDRFPEDASTTLVERAADRILSSAGVTKGICLVLGCGSGRLAYELAWRTELRVIGVDIDPAKVKSARSTLLRLGAYGDRVTVHTVESYSEMPFTSHFANLIVSESMIVEGACIGTASEMFRVLRPSGGVAYLGQPQDAAKRLAVDELKAWLEPLSLKPKIESSPNGVWAEVVRGDLEGAGEWSHLYGRADNAAFGGELLSGVRSAADLRVQWLGRPGPRGQPDRNGRKPSPLSTNGRLFVQGSKRVVGLDAYNGTVLWGLEVPPLERFNMPRDSSNWCADADNVFLAVRDRCWQIDAQFGHVVKFHAPISGPRADWQYDWGYLARMGDKLLGSAVKSGTAFTNFWGGAGAGWYDARSGPATFKVCSDNLFAFNVADGSHAWTYERGVVINPTITAADNRIFFVECRSAAVKQSASRRIGMEDLWRELYLVTLDASSGEVQWEQPLEITAGVVVFYMAHGSNLLVIVSSSDEKYDVYAYNAFSGERVWHNEFGWPEGKGDHGKAMSRPAIVGQRVFVRPKVFDLYSGKALVMEMPLGGCGTYAATAGAFIYRSEGKVSVWDTESGKKTAFDRLRPGCWLSTIPAAGMLLSPEAGGGCSCGSWMETSIGFAPPR